MTCVWLVTWAAIMATILAIFLRPPRRNLLLAILRNISAVQGGTFVMLPSAMVATCTYSECATNAWIVQTGTTASNALKALQPLIKDIGSPRYMTRFQNLEPTTLDITASTAMAHAARGKQIRPTFTESVTNVLCVTTPTSAQNARLLR